MLDQNTIILLNQLGVDPAMVENIFRTLVAATIVTLIAAIPTAIIAKRKRRSVFWWLILALSIPLIPLLLVWLLPARQAPGEQPK